MLWVRCSGGSGFVSESSWEPQKSWDLSASHRHVLWDVRGCNRISLVVRELGNFGICQQVCSGALGVSGFVSRSARELRESRDLSVSPRRVLRDVTHGNHYATVVMEWLQHYKIVHIWNSHRDHAYEHCCGLGGVVDLEFGCFPCFEDIGFGSNVPLE